MERLLKTGLLTVDKLKQIEWNNRLLCLKEQIDFWIDPSNILDKTIHTIYLFYDK
jgi:hypothetical protein